MRWQAQPGRRRDVWHPVRVGGVCVWLETIERRYQRDTASGHLLAEYRLPPGPPAEEAS